MRHFVLALTLSLARSVWNSEQMGWRRSASVQYSLADGPPTEHATVYEAFLGNSGFEGHSLESSSSAVTTTHGGGLVLATDTLCNLLAFRMPEKLPQRPDGSRGTWEPVWSYTASASSPDLPDAECTTPVVSGARVAWVSKQQHRLYAVNVAGLQPAPLPGFPLDLPREFLAPGSWTTFLSLLVVNGSVWVPSHAAAPAGALRVDLATGSWVWAASNKTNASVTGGAAGSVGLPHSAVKNPDSAGAAFIMDNVNKPLEFLRSDGAHIWTSTVTFKVGARHQHPLLVALPGSRHCVLMLRDGGGGIFAAAVRTVSGIHCYSWPTSELELLNAFTVSAGGGSAWGVWEYMAHPCHAHTRTH